jgi:hypothetical protein
MCNYDNLVVEDSSNNKTIEQLQYMIQLCWVAENHTIPPICYMMGTNNPVNREWGMALYYHHTTSASVQMNM